VCRPFGTQLGLTAPAATVQIQAANTNLVLRVFMYYLARFR
jgi:hypothetical protein